ncbi:MAG: SDR family oxidoreductase [Candidatus Limnocylindria bacterium]
MASSTSDTTAECRSFAIASNSRSSVVTSSSRPVPPPALLGVPALDSVGRLRSAVPLGRLGKASEIAKLAAYLASDDAGFITGEIIRCAGGTALSA